MMTRHTKVTNAQTVTPVLGAQVPAKTTTPPQPHATPQPQQVVTQQIQPGDPFADIKAKFDALKKLSKQVEAVKPVYEKQDDLMAELLPLFLQEVGNDIIIHKRITLGNDVYELEPVFIKDGKIQMKAWKSVAQRMFTIK